MKFTHLPILLMITFWTCLPSIFSLLVLPECCHKASPALSSGSGLPFRVIHQIAFNSDFTFSVSIFLSSYWPYCALYWLCSHPTPQYSPWPLYAIHPMIYPNQTLYTFTYKLCKVHPISMPLKSHFLCLACSLPSQPIHEKSPNPKV